MSIKVTDDEIIEKIKKKNPNIEFISSKIICHGKKKRRLVIMKCSCGATFQKVLDKISNDKYLLCQKCSRAKQQETRKKHYNKKYYPQIIAEGYRLINPNEPLYANKLVEVEQVETGYRGFISPNRATRRMIVFGLEHNTKNFIYNINKYAENEGIGSRAIRLYDDGTWNTQGIECVCECGTKFTTTYRAFCKGKFYCNECTKVRSRAEKNVAAFLDQQGISYIEQFRINSLRDINPLAFDFCLKETGFFIEVDGEQHRRPVNFRGVMTQEQMEKRFVKQQHRDKLKNEYCEKYNIPLLRLPDYDVFSGEYKDVILNFIQTAGN